MTKEQLQLIYDKQYKQVGDTDRDYLEWEVYYLLKLVNKKFIKTGG